MAVVMGGAGSGAKVKTWPAEVVMSVADSYHRGMTQAEIGQELGLSQKVIWNLMRRSGLTARVAAKRDQRGANNHMWRGADAGYQALHVRLDHLYGKPCVCQDCDTTDPAKTYDWANLTGDYANPEDFVRLCRSMPLYL